MNKILCPIGIHQWHFLLSEVDYIPLHGWPAGTKCLHCGKPHPRPLPTPQAGEGEV